MLWQSQSSRTSSRASSRVQENLDARRRFGKIRQEDQSLGSTSVPRAAKWSGSTLEEQRDTGERDDTHVDMLRAKIERVRAYVTEIYSKLRRDEYKKQTYHTKN